MGVGVPAPPTGGAVGAGVFVGVGVGDGVAVGVGVGGGVGVGDGVVRVKDKAVHEEGTAASGFEVGAVGATGCCLS